MSRLIAREQVGELDQRVELQTQSRVSDGMGGSTVSWVTQDTVWAHVRPLSGGESQRFGGIEATGGYRVAIRNRSDLSINETWRVNWTDRGTTMNIRFVEDGGKRNLYLVLQCEQGVAT